MRNILNVQFASKSPPPQSRVRVLLRSPRPERSYCFSDTNNGVSRYWVSRIGLKELCVNLRVAPFWLLFYSSVTFRVTDPSPLSYFLTPPSSYTRRYLHLYKGKTSSLRHHLLILWKHQRKLFCKMAKNSSLLFSLLTWKPGAIAPMVRLRNPDFSIPLVCIAAVSAISAQCADHSDAVSRGG